MKQLGSRGHVPSPRIVIGLVNNSSDRGLAITERQFHTLLREACGVAQLDLLCSTCPEIPRLTRPVTVYGQPYVCLDDLFASKLDALIVTGMEPRAARLEDEPCWKSLVALVDWAARRSLPTIWSCLAAHAAVFHLDGVFRVRLPRKLSGVFVCRTVSETHPLMAGLSPVRVNPHSRFYDLQEVALSACGYAILSHSEQAGADIFTRPGSAPFVFFQGHPEYGPETLLRELRRDVRRYLAGESKRYPDTPAHYFSPNAEATLARFRSRALATPSDPALLAELSGLPIYPDAWSDGWRSWARQIYANWIASWLHHRTGRLLTEPNLRPVVASYFH
jgi:homoserine O-succinyltransferase/O-acetyltransferase